MSLNPGLLLLADGRSPTGGLAHSGGVEEAVRAGVVHDDDSLLQLLEVRLVTAGAVAAGLAAAACSAVHPQEECLSQNCLQMLEFLDSEADARIPSEAARAASRIQGRGLVRLARASWPHPGYARGGVLGEKPHHPLVLGVATAAAGGAPADAASLSALASVSGPASAAVRLLGLDPIAVTGLLARLGARVEAIAATATAAAARSELPAGGHPLLDILAERHAANPSTLFTS